MGFTGFSLGSLAFPEEGSFLDHFYDLHCLLKVLGFTYLGIVREGGVTLDDVKTTDFFPFDRIPDS